VMGYSSSQSSVALLLCGATFVRALNLGSHSSSSYPSYHSYLPRFGLQTL
jgi:hypothetical protein